MPPRPLEGRISRLIGPNQMVRCIVNDGRIQHVPYVPKIDYEMDKDRDHPNLPTETHDSFQTPSVMAERKKLERSVLPENLTERLDQQQVEAQSLALSGDTRKKAYDSQQPKNYLKEMAEKHTKDLKELTEKTRWKEAELRDHQHDLTLLRRKVDYTSPKMQPPVYYDTLHKIYTSKAPFYYDGDNPYEYDYVLPWDYHKTKTVLDDYKRQGEELEAGKKTGEIKSLRKSQNDEYQFVGYPGANPFVSEGSPMDNERLPRAQSAPPPQQPTSQSTYTYSYSPDKIRTVDQPLRMSNLAASLPSESGDSGYDSNNSGRIDSSQLKHPAEANYDMSTSNPNATSGSSKPLYDPAYRNPHSNPVVSARHFNPGGSVDRRVDWSSPDPMAVRPQTSLLNLQDSFTKSDARKKFHVTFAESTPDLRGSIHTGKKHEFQGQNAYYWH